MSSEKNSSKGDVYQSDVAPVFSAILPALEAIESEQEVELGWRESLLIYFFKLAREETEDLKYLAPVLEADAGQVLDFLESPEFPAKGVGKVQGLLAGISAFQARGERSVVIQKITSEGNKTSTYIFRAGPKLPPPHKIPFIVLPGTEREDFNLKIVALDSERRLRTYAGHTAGINSIVLSDDRRRMVSASADGTLRLWDLESEPPGLESSDRKPAQIFAGHTSGVYSMVLMKDGRRMASASADKTLKLWDLSTGSCLRTYTGHKCGVWSVASTKDSQRIISASQDKTLKLWDVETGDCLQTYTGHNDWVSLVVLTDDDKRILSASFDNTLKLWDAERGICLRTYTGHKDQITSFLLAEDNKHIISASYDKTLKLWDLKTGACLRTCAGSKDSLASVVSPKLWVAATKTFTQSQDDGRTITSLSLSEDKKLIISVDDAGVLKLLDVEKGVCLKSYPFCATGALVSL